MKYLDLLPDGVLLVNRDGTVAFANRAALGILEVPPDGIVGTRCREAFRQEREPSGREDLVCPDAAVFERGEATRVVYRCASAGGSERAYSVSYVPVRDDRGEVVQAMGILRDVTGAEKTKGEILREAFAHEIVGSLSEEYLRDGGLKVGMALTVKKIREYYRPDFIEILLPDRERRELVLESGDGWDGPFVVPIAEQYVEGYVYLNDRSVRTPDLSREGFAAAGHLERHGVRAGLWLPIPAEESSVVVGVGGICYRGAVEVPPSETWVLAAILKDLSVYIRKERALNELRESKDFVYSILEGIGDGVVVIDRDLRIVNANKGYLSQVRRSRAETIGRHCYEVSHHLDRPCNLAGEECSVKQAFETGSSRRVIHTHYERDGSPVYIETVSYPLKDSSGKVVSAVEVLTDVSERVALEREVQKRIAELEDFYEIAVDRELKMKELKEELASLKSTTGR